MKRSAPAALRNRDAILAVLRDVLGPAARVLEIGSGTGQHAELFTERMPGWIWQPTELSEANVASIEGYRSDAGRENFLRPLRLDVTGEDWPKDRYDAVFSANVIHIAPWPVTLALFAGAARLLSPTGLLVLYGPFRFSGEFTAESNAHFDAHLRGEDPAWGVRDFVELERAAIARDFASPRIIPMPANNHVLVFARV